MGGKSKPECRSIDARDVLALLDLEELEALRTEQGSDNPDEALEAYDASYLLQWLAVRRTPFVKMAVGVCSMLASLETSLRGNISFIVLPEHGTDLTVDFRPQMRSAVATALRMSELGNSVVGIDRRAKEARRRVRQLCDNFRPQPVNRPDPTGKMLLDRAATTHDPRERFKSEFQARHFSHQHYEFNPADVAAMARIAAATENLKALAERLFGQAQAASRPFATDGVADTALLRTLGEMARSTATKSAQACAQSSKESPPAGPTLPASRYQGVESSIAALKSALLAASDAEQATSELFDFFSLEFWKQRWRLYELWILGRVLEWFTKRGARVCDSSRIKEGRWLLKFTHDLRPVLGFEFAGKPFDLYYQYFEVGTERANMPDIALKLRDGAFVTVLDPKHGVTYSRNDLNEVCRRYAAAFTPAASCVMNYFPGAEPVERLSAAPACTVIYGLQPDSETVDLLDSELDTALGAAWRGAGTARTAIAVLLDVSPSTADVRHMLCDAARQAFCASLFACSAESRVLLFGGGIAADADVWDFFCGALDCSVTMEGTDIAGALCAALDRLTTSRLPVEIWLFTDGHGGVASETLTARLRQARASLRVWEATSEAAPSALREVVVAVGGEYRRVP
jgi:hypothetical protein